MSNYEEKRQDRIERFKRLAEKNHALAESKHKEASAISDMIPFGQPILVGHHSETRHRRDLDRIHNKHGQGFEAAKKADYYEERAKSAESNRTIFSDDPEAITKLKAKIKNAEDSQACMVAINKVWRKHGKPEPDNQTAWELIYKSVELKDLGISLDMLQRIRVSMASDPLTRAPFTYQLSNNSGNTKRMKDRLKTLEQQSEKTTQSHNIGDIEIVENVEANRVQILFPDIPSEEIRTELKRHGFRWSRTNTAWQRHLNNHAVYLAKQIISQ